MLSTLEFHEMSKIINCYFVDTLADRAIPSSSLLIKQHFILANSSWFASWIIITKKSKMALCHDDMKYLSDSYRFNFKTLFH
jgi:hypothetical protein